jgi:hypothetical protein
VGDRFSADPSQLRAAMAPWWLCLPSKVVVPCLCEQGHQLKPAHKTLRIIQVRLPTLQSAKAA